MAKRIFQSREQCTNRAKQLSVGRCYALTLLAISISLASVGRRYALTLFLHLQAKGVRSQIEPTNSRRATLPRQILCALVGRRYALTLSLPLQATGLRSQIEPTSSRKATLPRQILCALVGRRYALTLFLRPNLVAFDHRSNPPKALLKQR